jgi:hypothetical protein
MSKFKIEHGASKVRLVLLKTNIEDSISSDIDLMCQWSDNERKYIINELLRFAITQEEDFLKYKASHPSNSMRTTGETKASTPQTKTVTEPVRKTEPAQTNSNVHS